MNNEFSNGRQKSPTRQIASKHNPDEWIQASGHIGNFIKDSANFPGSILKSFSSNELNSLKTLMHDELKDFVPKFQGVTSLAASHNYTQQQPSPLQMYIVMQDLLDEFDTSRVYVMDCKMGVKTFRWEDDEVHLRPRPDFYQKMMKLDSSEPSPAEHAAKAISKARYMQFREVRSSSSRYGFRIDAIKKPNWSSRNFQNIKEYEEIKDIIEQFVDSKYSILKEYSAQLEDISNTLKNSKFFATHQLIGSSLLFIHQSIDEIKGGSGNANSKSFSVCSPKLRMIDFGKTTKLAENKTIKHSIVPTLNGQEEDGCEDGYLIGINSICKIFFELKEKCHSN